MGRLRVTLRDLRRSRRTIITFFFGLKPALGENEVHWAGSDPYRNCAVAGFDFFTSQPSGLAASASSALPSFAGEYLSPALAAQTAGGSTAAIAQAVADAGFNSEYAPEVYGARYRK
jgi:hypothetical protein